jgi:GT2 family glycosyltransferase
MYMEDLDLCYRFAQAGWRSWYAPEATVTHAKGGSAGRHRSARLTIAFHYGMFRCYRKHYARTRSILTNAAVYLGIGLKVTLALLASVLHPPGGRRRSR